MKGAELFPVSDYYKNNIIEAVTITRGGNWWTAALVIKEPRSNENIIKFYKWQFDKKTNNWKVRESYKVNDNKSLKNIIKVLKDLEKYLKPSKKDEISVNLFETD